MGEMAGRAVARTPKEIVARGYDAIALRYAEWAGKIESPALEWLRDLDARLPDGADVLEASFVHADALDLDIALGSLDAVVALSFFVHVPVEEQRELIARIGQWLDDGGLLLANFGAGAQGEDVDEDWLGAPMFFASLGVESHVPLLRDCGLEPLRDEVIVQREPGHGDVAFHWVLAKHD